MIKFIQAVNLQSLKTVTLMFPENGIVRLAGPNSNGKSILRKALTSIIQCRLHIASVRKALIRRTEREARCSIGLYNGDILDVHISIEARDTYYELIKNGQPPVRRYLLDKGLDTLVNEFGFHYSEKRGFSLNVCNLREPLFMIGTNGASNLEQFDSVATDYRSSAAIEHLTESIKEISDYGEKVLLRKQATEIALSGLKIYDIDAEQARRDKLTYLANNIEAFCVPGVSDVQPVSNVVDALDALSPPSVPLVNPVANLNGLLMLKVPAIPDVLPDTSVAFLDALSGATASLNLEDSKVQEYCISSSVLLLPDAPSTTFVAEVVERYHELSHALKTGVCPTCGKELVGVQGTVCQRPA